MSKKQQLKSGAKKAAKKKPRAADMTWMALAEVLGTSRQNLNALKKKLGGEAPPVSNVDAWQTLLAADSREGSAPADIKRKIAQERHGLLRAARQREEIRLSRDRNEFLDKSEAAAGIAKANSTLFHEAENWLLNELPRELAPINTPVGVLQVITVGWARMKAGYLKSLDELLAIPDEVAQAAGEKAA